MKRFLSCALALLVLMLPLCGLAQGVTVRTTSNLYAEESTAQAFMDALVAYEQASGNTIEDFSGIVDEMWRPTVVSDTASGLYDIVYYDAAGGDSAALLPYVVPMDEVLAAYPSAKLRSSKSMTEADGRIYAVPVRGTWLALYCNTDLFDMYGLALPTDWEKFEAAITKFAAESLVPVSASLTDMPHYLLESAILSSGSVEEHNARPANADQIPYSWLTGMELIRQLGTLKAFPATGSEVDTTQTFLEKEAAMQVDGTWLANTIPQESWDSTVMLPFPTYNPGADATAVVGQVPMGFYITRAAWDDPARRDAAMQLLEQLTSDEMVKKLAFAYDGALGQSALSMFLNMSAASGYIGDDMTPEARDQWGARAVDVASGTADPAQVIRDVVASGAFVQSY